MAKNVTLTWNAPASGEIPDKYHIYRKVDPVAHDTEFGDIATFPSPASQPAGTTTGGVTAFQTVHVGALSDAHTLLDTTATDNSLMHYCLRAVKDGVESDYASCVVGADGSDGQVFSIQTPV